MRWLYASQKPEKDLLFGYHRADEARRAFLIPLWNVYSFFVTYARIDGWIPAQPPPTGEPPQLDRWIRARLALLVETVTEDLTAFEPHWAAAAAQEFVGELSNWYLRRSRRRFWSRTGASAATDAEKTHAYATLYHVLTTLIRLLAPFVPFVTEAMYQNLVRSFDEAAPLSVHHLDWPTPDKQDADPGLVGEMALVLRLVSLGHAARNQAGRKVRQPLAEAAFALRSSEESEILVRNADLVADELNVKVVRALDAATEAVDFTLNPLPRQLGQKYGARFPRIREAILQLDPVAAAASLTEGRTIAVEVDGEMLEILPEEVEVRIAAHVGFAAAVDGPYVAALSTELTPELVDEGLAREATRRIQEARRQAGYDVAQRIRLKVRATPRLANALEVFRDSVAAEVLATSIQVEALEGSATGDVLHFDGESLEIETRPEEPSAID
jgi:isoleucyl-tRNA synthetase